MISRAQAEALLKLAEALEECERNEMELVTDYDGMLWIQHPETGAEIGAIGPGNGVSVRMAIAKLYPKSEAAE